MIEMTLHAFERFRNANITLSRTFLNAHIHNNFVLTTLYVVRGLNQRWRCM